MKSLIAMLFATGWLVSAGVHATQAEHVRSSHAWIRTLPGSLPAGGYVVLDNEADQPATLKSAASTSYASVMLHHSSTEGGMSRMRMVSTLVIPAHGQVVLAPAGYHLMLMQSNVPVTPGDAIKVTLTFTDGSSLPINFVARPANAIDDGSAEATVR